MTQRTTPTRPLHTPPIPVQVRLAAAWTAFMFLYVYVDVLNFYKPGVVAGILDGLLWQFDVTPTVLTAVLVSVSVPAVMVMLSLVLPAGANRRTNLVVATLYVPYSMFNAAGTSWDWAAFYGISIGTESALLVFVLISAWRWPRVPAPAAP